MRNLDKAGDLRSAAAEAGVALEIREMDVTDRESVEHACAGVVQEAGRVDVLVNNAGIGAVAAVEDFDDDEVLRVFDTNVFGPIRVTRAVLPSMRGKRSGRIVNIGSLAAVVPTQFRGIYAATKSALAAITEALFFELHPFGIHACVIEPGFFQTAIDQNRMATRRQWSSVYAPVLKKYEPGDSMVPAGSKRVEPQPVIDTIVRAATEENPQRHYLVGEDGERIAGLRKAMSDADFAAIILRTMPSLDDA
jgi:NAD(P)-dependent dehydrogenase (short-subunit alcohol dehydrogenase family)